MNAPASSGLVWGFLMKVSTPSSLLERLAAIVGPANALFAAKDQARYLTEWRDLFSGETPVVLRPGSTGEVAAIVRLAAEAGARIVPQGGNTGLVGGQIPVAGSGEIVVSLERLDRIRSLDAAGNTMVVEAGATLAAVHEAAEAAGRMFPLRLASEGSCQVGGTVSTNAGGTAVLAYGNMRALVLGLEVVLADGRVWNGLRRLSKDNSGYDLKQLFIGAEGTLGIVTAASLRLFHPPKGRATAFVGLGSASSALALFVRAQAYAGVSLTGFELMAGLAVDFAVRHIDGARLPTEERHPWYALVEISSGLGAAEADAALERILSEALEAGDVADAALARSIAQGEAFWRLRHGMSEVQKHEGGSIKHDVSVPIADMPAFLDEAMAAVVRAFPGARPVPFGHMGDGNIHFNVSQPIGADKAAFLASWEAMNAVVHAVVLKYDGSIAAEHGVGRLKAGLLAATKPDLDLELMGRLKATLDPAGVFNPGRILREAAK